MDARAEAADAGGQARKPPRRSPIVVTLVHGTFAKDAAWVKDGSVLRAEIAGALAGHGRDVVFDVFTWSGRNSHKARIKAGYELADHIRALRTKGIHRARHFIVAHSHGGNVALLAHKHLKPAHHVTGIATLGTPFLHAELLGEGRWRGPQWYELQRAEPSEAATGFIQFFAFMVLMVTLAPPLARRIEDGEVWAFAIAGVALRLMHRPVHRFVSPYITWLWNIINGRRMAVRLADAIELPELQRTHVLSFVYPGDEAGVLLRMLGLTTKGPGWLMDTVLYYGLLLVGLLMPLAMVFGWASAFYSGFTGVDMEPYVNVVLSALVGILMGTFIIWLLLGAARYFLSFLRGHPGGFGWERPSLHRWIDIGTTAKAELRMARSNHTEIVSLPPAEGRKGLRHSGLYEDRRILKALAYWMAHVT